MVMAVTIIDMNIRKEHERGISVDPYRLDMSEVEHGI